MDENLKPFQSYHTLLVVLFLSVTIAVLDLTIMHFQPWILTKLPFIPKSYLSAMLLGVILAPILLLFISHNNAKQKNGNNDIRRKVYFATGIPLLIAIGLLAFIIEQQHHKVDELQKIEPIKKINSQSRELLHAINDELFTVGAFVFSSNETVTALTFNDTRMTTDKKLLQWADAFNQLPMQKQHQPERLIANKLREARNLAIIGANWANIAEKYESLSLIVLQEIRHIKSGVDLGKLAITQEKFTDLHRILLITHTFQAIVKTEPFRQVYSEHNTSKAQLNELKPLVQRGIEHEDIIMDSLLNSLSPDIKKLTQEYVNTYAVVEVKKIQRQHLARRNEVLIDKLQRLMGFNGLIHQYKNFVLRGEPKNAQAFNTLYTEFVRIVDELNAADYEDDAFFTQLANSQQVVNEYKNNLPIIARLHARDIPIEDIDKVTNVDDSPAVNALNFLQGYVWEFPWHKALQQLNQKEALIEKYAAQLEIDIQQQLDQKIASAQTRVYTFAAMAFLLIVIVIALVVIIIQNVSQAYVSQTKAYEQAAQANSMKDVFLANMSHEIRTPINGIFGTLQVLSRTRQKPMHETLISKALLSAKSLTTIINDILDFSKIEANKLTLESVEFKVDEIAQLVISDMHPIAVDKGIGLYLEYDDNFIDGWYGDPTRVHQILLNLVSNAVKFTKCGYVTVKISNDKTSSPERLKICVADTGIGMSREMTQKLFQRFEQGEQSTTREFGGTGLGMAITKSLVDIMHGEIKVASTSGGGTTFDVFLPFEKADFTPIKNSENKMHVPNLSGQRILLAEDNEINQLIVQSMLEQTHVTIDTVATGKEAVDSIANHKPDLILMDIQMPIMNGEEACMIIKKSFPTIPIIALTANVLEQDVRRYYQLGFDGHVSKPIDMKKLYSALNKYLSQEIQAIPTEG
ncbi:ATP-binding protein [Alteromonas sp. a30]|uniref:ATP-binding protein n=1 Tax=Alteromonas sp. a30 TaxID=2730917 RepID=UPI0022800A42|nr:ATP-binding protein [Alteromonas sp. a30]MCY7294616.1 response regulator [Alteromonas sp. a30]